MTQQLFISEQTVCPHCSNNLGNLVLQNDSDHWHRACGKCKKTYIVDVPHHGYECEIVRISVAKIGEELPKPMSAIVNQHHCHVSLARFGLQDYILLLKLD